MDKVLRGMFCPVCGVSFTLLYIPVSGYDVQCCPFCSSTELKEGRKITKDV